MEDKELLTFANTLTMEDMPSDNMRWVAEAIGIENAVKLALALDGMDLYISMDVRKRLQRLYVAKLWDGNNARQLCRKLKIPIRTIYRWLNEPAKPHRVQYDLFGKDKIEQDAL